MRSAGTNRCTGSSTRQPSNKTGPGATASDTRQIRAFEGWSVIARTGGALGNDVAVGVLFDYFSASSDDEAAAAIDRTGGPGGSAISSAEPASQRRLFGRRREAVHDAPTTSSKAFDSVTDTGIDPVVQMGKLEALLTGRPYEEVVADPRAGHAVVVRDEGQRVVTTLTSSLMASLAGADDGLLDAVAQPWSQTEEFWGQGNPQALGKLLRDLRGLAARAQAADKQLYCWICV